MSVEVVASSLLADEVLSFRKNDNRFIVLGEPSKSKRFIHLTTVNSDRIPLGLIQGRAQIIEGEIIFSSSFLANRQDQTSPHYFSRIVGLTIAELLAQEVIHEWRSSRDVSPDAQRLYENYLGSFPELLVLPQPELSYTVTKR